MSGRDSLTGDSPSWAPPRTGVRVERRDPWEVVSHGTLAGLIAGLGLGFVAIVASKVLRGDPWLDETFGWPAITALAQGARGEDPDGLRAEFVQLTKAARDVKAR